MLFDELVNPDTVAPKNKVKFVNSAVQKLGDTKLKVIVAVIIEHNKNVPILIEFLFSSYAMLL